MRLLPRVRRPAVPLQLGPLYESCAALPAVVRSFPGVVVPLVSPPPARRVEAPRAPGGGTSAALEVPALQVVAEVRAEARSEGKETDE